MFLCAKIMIRFYRVSLLFELGLSKNFDDVILVYISQELYSLRGSQKEMASNRFLYIAIGSC
jgi:dephospho-CoA kinase